MSRDLIEVHELRPAELTKSKRGHDRVIIGRALKICSDLGWIDVGDLLVHLGRSWSGSARVSGSIRKISQDLGYRILHRYQEDPPRLSIKVELR